MKMVDRLDGPQFWSGGRRTVEVMGVRRPRLLRNVWNVTGMGG